MEGDEGMYTCNVMILETNWSNTKEMILNGKLILHALRIYIHATLFSPIPGCKSGCS